MKDELLKSAAVMEKLSQVLEPDETDDHHAKILQPSPPKRTANMSRRESATSSCSTDEKAMIAAKRKLREVYQEAEDAKRQRTIKVIEAPKQQQRKRHPIVQERNRSRVASHTSSLRRRF